MPRTMKCAACGYEKRSEEFRTNEAVLYRSGKKKGQVKEVVEKVIKPFENDPEFIELTTKNGIDPLGQRIQGYYGYGYGCRGSDFSEVYLYACPKCGTLKIDPNEIY